MSYFNILRKDQIINIKEKKPFSRFFNDNFKEFNNESINTKIRTQQVNQCINQIKTDIMNLKENNIAVCMSFKNCNEKFFLTKYLKYYIAEKIKQDNGNLKLIKILDLSQLNIPTGNYHFLINIEFYLKALQQHEIIVITSSPFDSLGIISKISSSYETIKSEDYKKKTCNSKKLFIKLYSNTYSMEHLDFMNIIFSPNKKKLLPGDVNYYHRIKYIRDRIKYICKINKYRENNIRCALIIFGEIYQLLLRFWYKTKKLSPVICQIIASFFCVTDKYISINKHQLNIYKLAKFKNYLKSYCYKLPLTSLNLFIHGSKIILIDAINNKAIQIYGEYKKPIIKLGKNEYSFISEITKNNLLTIEHNKNEIATYKNRLQKDQFYFIADINRLNLEVVTLAQALEHLKLDKNVINEILKKIAQYIEYQSIANRQNRLAIKIYNRTLSYYKNKLNPIKISKKQSLIFDELQKQKFKQNLSYDINQKIVGLRNIINNSYRYPGNSNDLEKFREQLVMAQKNIIEATKYLNINHDPSFGNNYNVTRNNKRRKITSDYRRNLAPISSNNGFLKLQSIPQQLNSEIKENVITEKPKKIKKKKKQVNEIQIPQKQEQHQIYPNNNFIENYNFDDIFENNIKPGDENYTEVPEDSYNATFFEYFNML